MKADGENLDEDDAQPESRERVEDEGAARQHIIVHLVAPHGLQDPERDGDGDGDDGGQAEQQDRLREALGEQQRYRSVLDVRKAKVAVDQMVEVDPELVPDRPVQTLQFVEGGDCGRLGLDAELGSSRVAGQQVEQDEHDHGHEQQHNDGLPETPENVTSQSISPKVGSCKCAG